MVSVEQVRNSVEQHIQGTSHFVVAVEVRPGNKVVVEVEMPARVGMEIVVILH